MCDIELGGGCFKVGDDVGPEGQHQGWRCCETRWTAPKVGMMWDQMDSTKVGDDVGQDGQHKGWR